MTVDDRLRETAQELRGSVRGMDRVPTAVLARRARRRRTLGAVGGVVVVAAVAVLVVVLPIRPAPTTLPETSFAGELAIGDLGLWRRVDDPSGVFSVEPLVQTLAEDDGSVRIGVSGVQIYTVIEIPGGLLAGGEVATGLRTTAALWYSENGQEWERVADDPAVFGGPDVFGGTRINDLATDGTTIVAVGSDDTDGAGGAVWVSSDGRHWEKVTDPGGVFTSSGYLHARAVTAGGPGFVAVGNEVGGPDRGVAAVWVSTDGRSWQRVTSDSFTGPGSRAMGDVTTLGSRVVAGGQIGRDAGVWVSEDGLTWEVAYPVTPSIGLDQHILSVAATEQGLVAVGAKETSADVWDAAVWVSEDGLTWDQVATNNLALGGPGSQIMTAVATAGPGLVAVGQEHPDNQTPEAFNSVVWTSVDGTKWTRLPGPIEDNRGLQLWSVVGTNTGIIAVGWQTTDSPASRTTPWTDTQGNQIKPEDLIETSALATITTPTESGVVLYTPVK